jgi:hypothetical protein
VGLINYFLVRVNEELRFLWFPNTSVVFSMHRWVTSPKTPINPPGNLVLAQSITQAADSLEVALARSHALWNNGINKKAAFRRLLRHQRRVQEVDKYMGPQPPRRHRLFPFSSNCVMPARRRLHSSTSPRSVRLDNMGLLF